MPLADIVNISITAETRTPSRAGFGTPLFMAYHTNFLDLTRLYDSPSAMLLDGFLVTDPAYIWAQKVFSQSPRVESVKIGRRTLPYSQVVELTPTDTTEGLIYQVTIGGEEATYTVIALDTVADIVTGLFTAIGALTGAFTPTDNATEVSVAADNPGELFAFTDLNAELSIEDVTADPGITTDLAAVRLFDTDWYGLTIDSQSSAEVLAAAAWAESETVLFGATSSDTAIAEVGAGDLGSLLQGLGYARTYLLFHHDPMTYGAGAWQGDRLPTDPGSSTWAYKALAGIAVSTVNANQVAQLKAKDVNWYYVVGGLSITRTGITSAGEYIDVTRGIDWLGARMQEDIFSVLANNEKVPYEDGSPGTDLIRNAMEGVLTRATTRNVLARDPEFTITIPEVLTVSAVDRGNRHLPDVEFDGRLAGAIHTLDVTGRLAV